MQYDNYLDDVCKHIRFKAARKVLRKELAAHIDDKKTELEKSGAQDAEAKAIAAMGDAQETGKALNAIHKPRTAWGVIVCVVLLSIIGLVIQRITSNNDINFGNFGSSMHDLITMFIIQVCTMVGMYFFNYTSLIRLRYIFFGLALIMIIVYSANDNSLGLFSQTGTIAICSLLFLLSIIGFIEKTKSKGILGLVLVCMLCAASLAAIMLIPASSYALILAIVYLIVICTAIHQKCFSTNHQWFNYLITFGIIAAVLYAVISISPYSIYKLLDNWSFGLNLGVDYNTTSVSEMLKDAQFIGSSPYYISNQAYSLHGSSTTYIFTVIISAYGWLLGFGIVILFIAMFTFMIIRSQKIRHTFGKLLATGISTFLLIKFVISILTNVGLFGGMETNLPFMSYGRFDCVGHALLIGIFLCVWRRSTFMQKDTEYDKTMLFLKTKQQIAGWFNHT